MVNTEFQAKISKQFKSSHSQAITKQIMSFKADLTLKVKVKVISFQTHLRHFKIHLKLEGKIQNNSNFGS